MYLAASFHYCLHTEIAIAKVEQLGIKKEQILAVPLEVKGETRNIFDTIHHADGISMFDGGAILGSACMVLGVIYGFILEWGPIIWGLIGLAGDSSSGSFSTYTTLNSNIPKKGEMIRIQNCF
ncbi:MAG: hypothetical protein ABFD08_18120 [Syntrophomonas sp.]